MGRSDASKIRFGEMIKLKDLATFALSFDTGHNFTLRVGNLPAGSVTIKIGRAVRINILRASQDNPARISSLPKI